MQFDFSALRFCHIQYFIDQAQQKFGRDIDFVQVLACLPGKFHLLCQICHADYDFLYELLQLRVVIKYRAGFPGLVRDDTKLKEFVKEIIVSMIMPVGASNFTDAIRMGSEVFHNLKSVLKKLGYSTNVGDEGGFAPNLKSNEEAITVILQAIEKAGYVPGKDVYIGLDPASSEYFIPEENVYHLHKSTGDKLTPAQMVDYWKSWVDKYPIISIEDGMAEDDWDGWKLMTDKLGSKIQLVGDDLFVTNVERLQEGINKQVANSILIKVNQIGTLTETINAVNLANRHE